MGSLPEDLWENIIARLPLKTITTYKLVCKQWKSIVESPFFGQCFMFHHKNSHSSWSLICRTSKKELVAHYGCETWGLSRSLGSYVSSFLAEEFKTQKETVRVLAYTDVGLILVGFESSLTYYVANPISRQCVKIPPRPPIGEHEEWLKPGLATRIEKDVLLGYKVCLVEASNIRTGVLSLLVYSSETGLWSYKTLQRFPGLTSLTRFAPITLNGNIYWLGLHLWSNRHADNWGFVVVTHDLNADSDTCRLIRHPDKLISGTKKQLSQCCTISQGFLMYTNVAYKNKEYKLRLWRLESGEWHLVSKSSFVASLDYYPLGINPFDADTMYMWSKMVNGLFASTSFCRGQFRVHTSVERSSDGRTLSFADKWDPENEPDNKHAPFALRFVLPRWLHRIPSSPS